MRIASLIYSLAGGGGRVAADLVSGLSDCEHVIFYIGSDPQFSTGMERRLAEAGVRVRRALNADLSRELALFKPDVVFYHWWPLPSNAYDPAIIKKYAPAILISHYNAPPPMGFEFYVAVSRFGTDFMRGLDKRKVFVIYNGIDTAFYDVEKEPHEGFINGRVSSLEAKKITLDYPAFLNSFEIRGFKNIIVGEGPRRAELIAEAERMNALDKFIFPGRLENERVRDLLRSFDVSVYLTDTHLEVHSISLLEKARAGVPIIAEPRGGIPEQVIHGETGFLSHRLEEIKAFCEELAKNDRELKRMSQNAKEFAGKFSIERMTESYRKLLREEVLKC